MLAPKAQSLGFRMDTDAIPPSSPPRMEPAQLPSSPLFDPREEHIFSPKSSSPPPLFSSDDSRDSIDVTNYESPRIYKNKRKGTWWNNRETTSDAPQSKKKKMSRNFDSGVYMMSDATDSSEDMLPQHNSPFEFNNTHNEKKPSKHEAETAFNDILRAGLERNLEEYDFRALNLKDEDISQIGNLISIIKNVPDPGSHLPAEGQYRSMVPELYVNISQNSLCRLTPSIFNIQTLTTLVLRDNQIRELPQQIDQLQNLHVLDVSLNKLAFLPFDILRLFHPHGSLMRVVTMGNPLLEPISTARFSQRPFGIAFDPVLELPRLYDSLEASSDPELTVWCIRFAETLAHDFDSAEEEQAEDSLVDQKKHEHHSHLASSTKDICKPRHIARTLVCFLDEAGRVVKGSAAVPGSNEEDYHLIIDTNRGTYGAPASLGFIPSSPSRVASLLTTTLHNAFEKRNNGEYSIEDVRDMLPRPIPPSASAVFDRAIQNQIGGYSEFRRCHVCRKNYVIARAEWVEFWCAGHSMFYPMKVAVCSWGCVPEAMMKRPDKELV